MNLARLSPRDRFAQAWRHRPAWLPIAAVALSYAVVGRLSLLLALPPGYATAVWPAAGIAVVAVLLLGRRAALGVAAGSFLANTWTSLDTTSHTSILTSLSVATLLGVGAALQAVAGAALVRRTLGQNYQLIRDYDILRFLILGGPVACLIGASCGIATLHGVGQLPTPAIPFSWFTWWVGDSIGVLIFAPLTLMTIAGSTCTWRSRRLTVGLPLAATFAAAVLVFVLSSRAEQARDRGEFDSHARDLISSIQTRIQNSSDKLRAVASLFNSAHSVNRDQFRNFVAGVLRSDDGIQGISFSQLVADADRAAFERQMRGDGVADFQIKTWNSDRTLRDASPRDQYLAVTYIEPMATNGSALGLDLLSRPILRGPIADACDGACLAASPPMPVIRSMSPQNSVAIFYPLYQPGIEPRSAAERRERLIGFTSALFCIDDLIAAATRSIQKDGLIVRLTDVTSGGALPLTKAAGGADPHGAMRAEQTFDVAGRQWCIEISRPAIFLLAHRSFQSWAVLVGGLLFASILGGFLLVLTGRTHLVESLIAVRTDDLQQTNALLAAEQQASESIMRQLRASRDAAEKATAAKSQFLANMTHEIRSPLTAIVGFADLLAMDAAPSQQVMARTIRSNSQHLLEVINDILDFSKSESGQLLLEKTPCTAQALMRFVIEAMQPLADEKRITLTAHAAAGDDQAFLSDPFRLRQVMLNLVSNALKFTPPLGQVDLRTDVQQHDGRVTVRLTVADTGMGMDADQLGRLFHPFTQADASTTRRFGGTGLGLAISRRIMERLGGQISVVSQPRIGSVFTVLFDADCADADALSSTDSPSVFPPIQLRGCVLVVDDLPDNRRLVRAYLERTGLAVLEAQNGKVAIDALTRADPQTQRIDAIIMDMQMPEMDGYEATARLRKLGIAQPIIALTAHTADGDREKCLAAGCSAYVGKPIDMEHLLTAVANALQLPIRPFPAVGNRPDPALPIRSIHANHPLVAPLLPAYLIHLADSIDKLRDAIRLGDGGAAGRILHTIKGSAGSYGYPSITNLAAAAHRSLAATANSLSPSALEQIEDLLTAVHQIEGLPTRCAAPTSNAA